MQDAHDLGVMIDSQVPLILMESHDESRALDMLLKIARQRQLSLSTWTVTDGLKKRDFGLQLETAVQHDSPEAVLNYLKTRAVQGIYVLCDFHHWLTDQPKNIRLLKDIALRQSHSNLTVILLSHALDLSPELLRLSAQFSLSLPSDEAIREIVEQEAKSWAQRNHGRKVSTNRDALQQLVTSLHGLTPDEVRRMARTAIVDDGAITESDIPGINRAKFALLDMEGVLSYELDTEKFTSVGGMKNLKLWLSKRRAAFNTDNDLLDKPRGILLLGVQGGGKSLAAKAVAGSWQLPFLRLDMGALYNKYFGETERNLRQSLTLAEKMAPCVLWIDEIEKGISSSGNDSGLSQRVLGTLLTWMAERKEPVFIVATSNDVSSLPPELIRKGRLDELFFVDLPDAKTRQTIFDIHLAKRKLSSKTFDLSALAAASEGFSGAEIEQVIVSAVYSALADKIPVSQQILLQELADTVPLSIVMAEKLDWLRNWARQRNVVMA